MVSREGRLWRLFDAVVDAPPPAVDATFLA
jgi:hypothetical protein